MIKRGSVDSLIPNPVYTGVYGILQKILKLNAKLPR